MKKLISSILLLALVSCTTSDKKESKITEDKPISVTEDKNENSTTSTKPKPMTNQSTCTSNKDVRIMEVKKTTLGGCELFYTKFGKTQSVATANIGMEYCEEVKNRIQSNLEKAGFSCQ